MSARRVVLIAWFALGIPAIGAASDVRLAQADALAGNSADDPARSDRRSGQDAPGADSAEDAAQDDRLSAQADAPAGNATRSEPVLAQADVLAGNSVDDAAQGDRLSAQADAPAGDGPRSERVLAQADVLAGNSADDVAWPDRISARADAPAGNSADDAARSVWLVAQADGPASNSANDAARSELLFGQADAPRVPAPADEDDTADVSAQTRAVASTSVSAESVTLGEPFTVTVTITHAPDERFELLEPKQAEAFELLGQDRQREDGRDQTTTTFTLNWALFELGEQTLPPLEFDVTSPRGSSRFVTPLPKISGAPTLPPNAEEEGAELEDFKAPVDVPVRSWRLVWIAVSVLAALVLGFLLVRWLRALRARLFKPAPPLPLEARTRAALNALADAHLPEAGRSREFYFRLSEILRAHLGERYEFEALECTGSELLTRLDRVKAPELPREELRRFVEESDLVKFAKMEVDAAACVAALNFGFELVSRTVPENVPQPRVP